MHGAREIGLRTGESHPRPLAHKSHLNLITMHPGTPSIFCFTEFQHIYARPLFVYKTMVYSFVVIVNVIFRKGAVVLFSRSQQIQVAPAEAQFPSSDVRQLQLWRRCRDGVVSTYPASSTTTWLPAS